jgi:cyanophycinase-like exopeptidase
VPGEWHAVRPPRGAGRLVLFGSCHLDLLSLPEILTLNERRAIEERAALLVDTASPEPDPDLAASLSALLGFEVKDSFLRDRVDAFDARAVERIGSAGAILLEGGSVLRLHSTLSASPALEALVAASDAGTVVIACSAGAQVLGHGCLARFGPEPEERPVRLLGWLGGLIIEPHCSGQAPRELLRRTLAAFPGSAGLGIAHRGAVVLSSGWKEVDEVATGWDGGSLILASEHSRPRWLRAGRHRLPRAAARRL